MDIEGTYTLQASPAEVWDCLMDHQVLRQAIPGMQQVEKLGENKYAITLHIGHTPLVGLYNGYVIVTDQHYPYYYGLTIEGEGGQSKLNGEGVVHLSGRGENTVVAYKGSLNLGKLETLLPPPIVKGTARHLLQQFFNSLAEQLRTTSHIEATIAGEGNETAAARKPVEVASLSITSPTFLQTIVHRLGLGAGDPALEALWVLRLKRMSVAIMLVALFWIGTRLPRR